MKCIFSVDVEDWFHILDIPGAPAMSEWGTMPSRVEGNFMRLLQILDEHQARATCFVLGWIAERFPGIVKEAAARGHEIASHGYSHRLAYEMTRAEFREDAAKAKALLEDLVGQAVIGYRSAGFSVTEKTPWFFDALMETGHRYDSSVFPAPRGHGGMKTARVAPHVVDLESGRIIEFPITVKSVLGKPVCFFGGGYLRLFPYCVIRKMARSVLKEGRPVVFYVHPRDIDPDQPRLAMGLKRRFKSYVNLSTTAPKINRILDDFDVGTFAEFIALNRNLLEGA